MAELLADSWCLVNAFRREDYQGWMGLLLHKVCSLFCLLAIAVPMVSFLVILCLAASEMAEWMLGQELQESSELQR